MSDSRTPQPPGEPRRGRTFSFSFKLGRKPPGDGPDVQRMIEEARREAGASPDGVGTASRDEQHFSMEYADGRLRIGGHDAAPPYERAPDEALPRLAEPGYAGGFPDTDAVRRVLRRIKLAIVVVLPVALVVAGIASGYSRETVIWMGIFGLVLSAMVGAMLPG